MAGTTIRIRPKSHDTLKEIAKATGQSLQDALDQAIELQQRQLYLNGLKSDYAALAEDPRAFEEFKKEISLWDSTADDGLRGL